MRIRQYPAIAFCGLVLISAYLGLAPQSSLSVPTYKQSDKVLHFLTFLLLTLSFYWILETSRRRVLHLTLFVCPLVLGVGSEVAQGLLPNVRNFDPYDIAANVVGSLIAIAASTFYHKRMLERKRQARTYNLVPGDDDLELGEVVDGHEGEETGTIGARSQTLEEEVDTWDENAEDWDDDETVADGKVDGSDVKAVRHETQATTVATEPVKRSD